MGQEPIEATLVAARPLRTRSYPAAVDVRGLSRADVESTVYGIWTPEIARAITSRWISEVPSKIV